MNRAEIIRDAITFGMGWAQSEGAVDDSTERDEALAALDELVAENQRLRDALTIMCHLDDANERERLLREALPQEPVT